MQGSSRACNGSRVRQTSTRATIFRGLTERYVSEKAEFPTGAISLRQAICLLQASSDEMTTATGQQDARREKRSKNGRRRFELKF